ncbi:MAG: class I SAM-dependent methyltransferase [Nitrospinaceae bacterium]|jgi:ubiquinone/menaquinone biosynthesis C-methylase UbiE|nr:class I SAM-dependent methyltransferase [Nitrospina sp.]MBT5376049.1 class I SAM-dependent methyltransferase [Nitrospinaceae bacterium]MBT5868999.1 class I SAM-dependent methyltransferase [Nitrospinaceae bacterium]MBT6347128.1 class I SAM-dependent methyltransferase [Nitrospina sp.]
MSENQRLDKIYRRRFNEYECEQKNKIWQVLCPEFFQKYVPLDATVLDIGAGYCEFINNIRCGKKLAVDLNEDTPSFSNPDVSVTSSPSTDLSFLTDNSIDRVFMSNFLEHLKTKQEILETFIEIFRVLKPGGKVITLHPNIRYLYMDYWDYFDHHVPLTDKSIAEGLEVVGLKVDVSIARFLPFTTKSKIPKHPTLVKLYLKFPFIWKIMGKQTFVVATKPTS